MTTARDLCIDALKESGALGVGQTPLAEDINDAFTRLDRMVAQWQKKRWLVPSLQSIYKIWPGTKSVTVGINGFFDIQRPNDVKGGYIIQINTGSNPVSLPLKKIFSYEDYIRIAVKDLPSLGTYFFYDGQFPLANLFVWPVPQDGQYEVHILIESLLGFGSTITSAVIESGGTLYTDGIYNNVPLIASGIFQSSVGSGATADITVTAGAIAVVNLLTGGQDYVINDSLSVNPADVGGTGGGFLYLVRNIGPNINTEIVMPPEYEEALMYNLAIRVCSMFQVPPMDETRRLAKASLNTIRVANTQIPALIMPNVPGLRTGPAFNIWNADGY